ncbi:PepSY domain-containing protein, partial [Ochrobactrum chromiisoli]
MFRVAHRWPGLLAALLLIVLSISGAALSIFPAVESVSSPQADVTRSIADLAARVQAVYPQVEQIRRAPSGLMTAYWIDNGAPQAAVIDPATGQAIASADPNPVERWLTSLHRSLFLDDSGRIVMAAGAAAMLVLSVSGLALVARRVGGWQRWFSRLRGPLSGRLHVEIARLAVVGLLLSSATALWMTASTFDLLPDGAVSPVMQTEASGQTGAVPATMEPLRQIPVAQLRSLSFADASNPTDILTLKTNQGTGYIDQGTGALIGWSDLTEWQRLSETIYMLHTGRGASVLGLLLGLMALGVPVMAGTGVFLWSNGRHGRPRIRENVAAGRAETIILVGSEGGSTWGFAATLHAALSNFGQTVHAAPMSAFDPGRYRQARRIIILAATYGDGDAPALAKGFLERLSPQAVGSAIPLAVLGFGDSSFPAYCAFARAVTETAHAAGWKMLIPFDTVDRQSPQAFARWGRTLGAAVGINLELTHQTVQPAAVPITLVSRRDYGAEVQAPAAILRFALPRLSFWQQVLGCRLGRFVAGDLLAIVPSGSTVPRFYSLASGRNDGFIEIVVRKHPGGLCSCQLLELEPGDTISACLRRNPGFHAEDRTHTPLILIGAGTGIAPLTGFIRANTRHRLIHLFFGMRQTNSDFFYGDELREWKQKGQ